MATCCNPITGNISKVCGAKKGGLLQTVYVANLCDITGVTLASGEVTAIGQASGTTFYQIGTKKNTAGFNNEATIGDNNKFWTQTVSFTVEGFDATTKAAFETMIDGDAVFIGVDNAQNAHLLGRVSGANMTAGTLGTGVAAGDLFGGTTTFLASELEITPSIAAGTTINVLDEDGVSVITVTF